MKDSYHHGNLRQALIEAGIRMINEYGEEALSLRKVAAACGVSHAAPYAHFKDKESLLEAIKETVTLQFIHELEEAIAAAGDGAAEDAVHEMGKRYILFFRNHPDYFYFLFHKQKLRVHTSMEKEDAADYLPFLILRRLFKRYIAENQIDMDEEMQEIELLKTWAIVQGFASIACMDSVQTSISWEKIVNECLK